MAISIPDQVIKNPNLPGLYFSRDLFRLKRIRSITLADISDQPLLSSRMLKSIEVRIGVPINTIRLQETGGGGVGGRWWISERIAEREGAEKIINLLDRKGFLQVIDTAVIIHSAGGGTGAGTGPVLANRLNKYFNSKNGEVSYGLLLSVTALPHEDDPIRRLNALSTIGRYDKLVDTIILFDNARWKLVKKIIGNSKKREMVEPVLLINDIFSRIFLWLNSVDGFLSRRRDHKIEPKDYEAADFKTLLRADNKTSLSVPFYGEYTIRELYKYKLLFLVLYTILQNSMVDIDPIHGFRNLLVIIGIPKILKETSKVQSLITSEELTTMRNYLNKYLRIYDRSEVLQVYYRPGNKIVITGLIINPIVRRLLDLETYIDEDLSKIKDEDIVDIYQDALDKYKSITSYARSEVSR